MEWIILGLFCLSLLSCVILGLPTMYALIAGLLLFLFYGRYKKFSWKELFFLCISGMKLIRNVIITFVLIGMLTATWRAGGTIPSIVCYAVKFINPSVFLLMTYLLNCLISVLTGTSLGTAATMGVICASIGHSLGIDITFTAGAILSGIYFGDRCSPVSTSALLVCEMTGTNIFDNIKNMVRTSVVPFVLSGIMYFILGFSASGSGIVPDLNGLFGQEFTLTWVSVIPVVVIAVLSLMQINVKIAMTASILTAIPVCHFVQGVAWEEFPMLLLAGFEAETMEVAKLLNGGGILSMVNAGVIVLISAFYPGLFDKTGLLDNVHLCIDKIREKTSNFTAVLLTSIVTSVISCSQTLAIMMTGQLASQKVEDKSEFALNMEDAVVVVSPLCPWATSAAVPLAAVGGSASAIIFAFYLYFLPLSRLVFDVVRIKIGRPLTLKRSES